MLDPHPLPEPAPHRPAPAAELDYHTLDLLPYGVIVVDADGRILFYNRREEEISRRDRSDVLGRNFFSEVAPCTQVIEFQGRFRDLMAHGEGSYEFHFVFPFEEGPRSVQISLQPFRKEEHSFCAIFVSDLTEREQLVERILQAHRFSELGEVAATVAHNFNNLLTVIQMAGELAQMEAAPATQVHLDRIQRAAADGAALVQRLRRMARTASPAPSAPVDLAQVVASALDYARQYAAQRRAEDGRRVDLESVLGQGPLTVAGDAGELGEALLNLLRNAIDAVPEEGSVRILAEADGDRVTLEVLDNGTGMAPEVQQRIFTPMFTTKGDRGTGLGLASVYAAVRRHGGQVTVRSRPGRGTRVRIELPAPPAP